MCSWVAYWLGNIEWQVGYGQGFAMVAFAEAVVGAVCVLRSCSILAALITA
jgi:uncharacterized membrane protein YeaQ/YmgE (transglycosylase-associated protein family)